MLLDNFPGVNIFPEMAWEESYYWKESTILELWIRYPVKTFPSENYTLHVQKNIHPQKFSRVKSSIGWNDMGSAFCDYGEMKEFFYIH